MVDSFTALVIRCPLSSWNATEERASVTRKFLDGVSINATLEGLELQAKQLFRKFDIEGVLITNDLFKKALERSRGNSTKEPTPTEPTRRSALSIWEERLISRKKTQAHGTYKTENGSYNSFKKFLEKYNLDKYSSDQFLTSDIEKYFEYLSELNRANTVSKKIKHLKAFFKFLRKNKAVVSIDLDSIKAVERPGNKLHLTQDELNGIIHADLHDDYKLDKVRDLFVIQCCTGLRVSDLKRLGRQHITAEVILIRAFKNQSDIEIPITPLVKSIFEKYDYALPYLSDAKYNLYLKGVI